MRIVTIRDVAEKAGVSISTVSRVLNERMDVDPQTREKVQSAIAKLHYVRNNNARNLKQRHTEFVAVILHGRRNIFLTDIAERILEYGKETSCQFLLEFIDEKADEFRAARRLYLERKLSGIIFLGSNISGREKDVVQLDLPCVFSTVEASSLKNQKVCSVSVDNRKGGMDAANRLFKLGHKRIAVAGYQGERNDGTGQRFAGSMDSYQMHGEAFDPNLFIHTDFTLKGAYDATIKVLETTRDFTAVFAISDMIAIGVIRALRDQGLRVPEDVSVIGFDGIELASYITPSLATMRQPVDEIAKTSVSLLIDSIAGKPSRHVLLDTEPVAGDSVRSV
jgi:LacI family transcriptional regulator